MEMTNEKGIKSLITDGHDLMPGLSIDPVIFGFHEGQLKILLLRFRGMDAFALPGGFVHLLEDVDEAAARVLFERTGLREIYLDQFYTFGKRDRRDAGTQQILLLGNGVELPKVHWLLQRFVSIGYYALIDFTKANPTPDLLSDSCGWHDLANLPPLIFDHAAMVQKALETLQKNLDDKLIGFSLLPETFTMADLQQLYETILGKPLQRTNFQRKILSLGILERLEKKMSGGAHKAPYLYRFIFPATP